MRDFFAINVTPDLGGKEGRAPFSLSDGSGTPWQTNTNGRS
jgi:hypothetical protein